MEINREVDSRRIIFFGIVSVLALVVVGVGAHGWYKFEERREINAKGSNSQPLELIELRTQQQASLQKYGWANKEKTAVMIPLDKAQQYVIEKQGKLPASRPAN